MFDAGVSDFRLLVALAAASEVGLNALQQRMKSSVAADRAQILEKLHPSSDGELFHGYQQNYRDLYDLVKQTVEKGESNSLLLLGPRGVGKSLLLRKVLADVGRDESFVKNGLIVNLSGLLQTDDKLALKEITKQLQLENVVGDKVFGSFAEHLDFLLRSLRSGDRQQSKPIIFLLDEFHRFTAHHNQTLLYNLFDVAQSRAAPLCVIGVSVRLDVVESLEKRVKSRFSHRQLYMLPVDKFEDYLDMAGRLLTASSGSGAWNSAVSKLLKDKVVRKLLHGVFLHRRDFDFLKRLLFAAVVEIDDDEETIDVEHIKSALAALEVDCDELLMGDLTVLEMCILIAGKHLKMLYDDQPFNFEMVFHEYHKFASRKSAVLLFERHVVAKAWESLIALELFTPIDKGGTKVEKEYRLYALQLRPEQLRRAVAAGAAAGGVPTDVKEWAATMAHA